MIINLGQNYTPLDKQSSSGQIELGMMRQSIDADTVKLEKYTKQTDLSVSKSRNKLSPPNTNNPSLTISNSVNKITITPPLGPVAKSKNLPKGPALPPKQDQPSPKRASPDMANTSAERE